MKALATYPIFVPQGKKQDGKQVVLIDLDRISATLVRYARPKEFLRLWGEDQLPDLLWRIMEHVNPILCKEMVSRWQSNAPLWKTHRFLGTDDPGAAMRTLEEMRAELRIPRWHFVAQTVGLVLNDSRGQPAPPFTTQLFIAAAATVDEGMVVVDIEGEARNQFILLPKPASKSVRKRP